MQDPRQPRVAAFGNAGCIERRLPLPLVEIHLEVIGADHLPLEASVLDLVLAEVLLRCRLCCPAHQKHGQESDQSSHDTHPFVPSCGTDTNTAASPTDARARRNPATPGGRPATT